MKALKENKITIIISLVIGTFLICFQSIIIYLRDLLVSMLIYTSEKFSNYYYSSVAKNAPNMFSEMNNILLIFLFAYTLIAIVFNFNITKQKCLSA